MSYQLARIDSEYNSLFPAGAPPSGAAVLQHRAEYQAWTRRSWARRRSRDASRRRSRPSMTRPRRRSRSSAVQGRSGEVAQLQLIVQMIGITNSELLIRNQTLATTRGVLTDMSAANASERQLSLGKSDDVRQGYTDKGAPVIVPTTLP